jgi:hypothetical protein
VYVQKNWSSIADAGGGARVGWLLSWGWLLGAETRR